MEQHPIPRQITTFEFKLIGFLTIKQFIYLVVFIPLGIITYYIFPVPILNILLGVGVGALGLGFAFVPINDRPMDVWVRNMYKRLISPTQYTFRKHNPSVYFLENLIFLNDPHRVLTHIESREKLTAYMAKTNPTQNGGKKQFINNLFRSATHSNTQKPSVQQKQTAPEQAVSGVAGIKQSVEQTPAVQKPKTPFFSGLIKNHKLIPIPGILIYVKDTSGKTLRLLKTNPHGVFATFNPLPVAEYLFEIKDPKNTYFFDTIKLKIDAKNTKPFEFASKEML